jgi:hypothetical protein
MKHHQNPSIKERISEWLELCDLSLELLQAGKSLIADSIQTDSLQKKRLCEKQIMKRRVLARMVTK